MNTELQKSKERALFSVAMLIYFIVWMAAGLVEGPSANFRAWVIWLFTSIGACGFGYCKARAR